MVTASHWKTNKHKGWKIICIPLSPMKTQSQLRLTANLPILTWARFKHIVPTVSLWSWWELELLHLSEGWSWLSCTASLRTVVNATSCRGRHPLSLCRDICELPLSAHACCSPRASQQHLLFLLLFCPFFCLSVGKEGFQHPHSSLELLRAVGHLISGGVCCGRWPWAHAVHLHQDQPAHATASLS